MTWLKTNSLDLLERVGKTVLYSFVAYMLASGFTVVQDAPWWNALLVALGAGLLSLITNLLGLQVPTSAPFYLQVAARAIKTFLQSFAALIVGATGTVDLLNVGWVHALQVAAGAALLSVLGSVASANVDTSATASLVQPKTAALTGGRLGHPVYAPDDLSAPADDDAVVDANGKHEA